MKNKTNLKICNIDESCGADKIKIRKYKNGGYVKEEKIDDGITVLVMDKKGWWEEFGSKVYGGKK